jgi:hypothetical protein
MDDEGLVLTGEVGDVTFIELLKSMAIRDKETGKLSLSHDGVTRTLYIREGRILSAVSTSPDERLGEVLVREGIITPQQYYAASEKIRPGLKLGRILIDLGALEPEELLDGVRLQCGEVIESVFELRKGEYRVVFEAFPAADMMNLSRTTEDILFRGIQSIRAFSRVMDAVGSLQSVYRPAPLADKILPALDLKEEEHHILSLAKGTLTAGQICEMSYTKAFATLKILWGLTALDLIETAQVGEAPRAAAPMNGETVLERANDLFMAIHDKLSALEIGAANRLYAETMAELQMSHTELDGCEFDSAGTFDPSPVLYNLTRARCPDTAAACRALVGEMVTVIAFKAKQIVGPEGEKAVLETVKGNSGALQ